MNLIVKLTSIFFIFVAPLYIIYDRYQVQEVERVQSSMSPVALMFIVIIVLTALWFAVQQFMHMVQENKFGFLSIIFFGLVLGLLLFLSWFVVDNIVNTARTNLELFLQTFEYHRDTLYYMLMSIAFGIGIAGIYKLITLKTKAT